MNTMLEPRIVAASVQRLCALPHSVDAALRASANVSSQGDFSRYTMAAAYSMCLPQRQLKRGAICRTPQKIRLEETLRV
jgi:hypothetical protein